MSKEFLAPTGDAPELRNAKGLPRLEAARALPGTDWLNATLSQRLSFGYHSPIKLISLERLPPVLAPVFSTYCVLWNNARSLIVRVGWKPTCARIIFVFVPKIIQSIWFPRYHFPNRKAVCAEAIVIITGSNKKIKNNFKDECYIKFNFPWL